MANSLPCQKAVSEPFTPIERSVRQLRAVARCLATSRNAGDILCEETLLAFLATDPPVHDALDCFPELVATLRRVYRDGLYLNDVTPDPDPVLGLLNHMPVEAREAAAVYLGAGTSPEETAQLLGRDVQSVAQALDAFSSSLMAAFARRETDKRYLSPCGTQI